MPSDDQDRLGGVDPSEIRAHEDVPHWVRATGAIHAPQTAGDGGVPRCNSRPPRDGADWETHDVDEFDDDELEAHACLKCVGILFDDDSVSTSQSRSPADVLEENGFEVESEGNGNDPTVLPDGGSSPSSNYYCRVCDEESDLSYKCSTCGKPADGDSDSSGAQELRPDGGEQLDHIYVGTTPGGRRWGTDYETVAEWAGGEENVTIMHTRAHETVLDLSEEYPFQCQMNRGYDCGHWAYGPPRELPDDCPECHPVATDGGTADRYGPFLYTGPQGYEAWGYRSRSGFIMLDWVPESVPDDEEVYDDGHQSLYHPLKDFRVSCKGTIDWGVTPPDDGDAEIGTDGRTTPDEVSVEAVDRPSVREAVLENVDELGNLGDEIGAPAGDVVDVTLADVDVGAHDVFETLAMLFRDGTLYQPAEGTLRRVDFGDAASGGDCPCGRFQ